MKKTLFKIEKQEVGRVLLHIPVGLLTVLLGYAAWWLAITSAGGFFIYQLNEDWHISDGAFTDIKGWLWGLFVGGCILCGLKLGGII